MVFKGPFTDKGMPDFTGKLTEADVVKIQAFIQGTADAVRPKPAEPDKKADAAPQK
jgi:quinohemoprotein ethanol dehydrogenase